MKRAYAKNLSRTFKAASPGQKIIGLLFICVVLSIAWYLWPSSIKSKQADTEDYQDTKAKAQVGSFNLKSDKTNYSVIENPNSPQGRMAKKADEERVKNQQRQGKSAIAAFTKEAEEFEDEKPAAIDMKASLKDALASLKKKNEIKIQPRDTSWINGAKPNVVIRNEGEKVVEVISDEQRRKNLLKNIPPEQLAELMNKYKTDAKSKMMALSRSRGNIEGGTSGGFKLISDPSQKIDPVDNGSAKSSYRSNGDSKGNNDGSEVVINTIIPQGSKLSSYSGRPIDSRFDTSFVLTIDMGQLEGATLSCRYKRSNDYLIPACSDITYQGQTVSVTAAVLNPDTMGAIINQSKDSETLLKTLSLLVAGTAAVYGENKFAQGTTVSTKDSTVVQESNLTDSELVAGAATTVIGTLNAEAMRYFLSEDIINIEPYESMIITLLKPIEAPWIMKKPLVNGVDYL